jgi:Ca-activated chloride channel family protein
MNKTCANNKLYYGDNTQARVASYWGGVWKVFCMIWALAMSCTLYAQTNRFLSEGNTLYQQQKFQKASALYRKALAKDPSNPTGLYNLGNALYQQKQYDSSRTYMSATEKRLADKTGKAAVNYNIGNSYMAEKKWEDAIKAYKSTLRNNPQDADSKYNLAYAQQMMKKEQQSGGGKNKQQDQKKDEKNKDQKKDKGDDQKDQKEQQDKKDQQDQNKDQDKKEEQEKQPQSQPSKMSEKEAERLLEALQNEEKKLQDKMKKEKGIKVKMDKDW